MRFDTHKFLILGDLNCPGIPWGEYDYTTTNYIANLKCRYLINHASFSNFIQQHSQLMWEYSSAVFVTFKHRKHKRELISFCPTTKISPSSVEDCSVFFPRQNDEDYLCRHNELA